MFTIESMHKNITGWDWITVSVGKVSISYERVIVLACLIWVTRQNHIPVGKDGVSQWAWCSLCPFYGAVQLEKVGLRPKRRKSFFWSLKLGLRDSWRCTSLPTISPTLSEVPASELSLLHSHFNLERPGNTLGDSLPIQVCRWLVLIPHTSSPAHHLPHGKWDCSSNYQSSRLRLCLMPAADCQDWCHHRNCLPCAYHSEHRKCSRWMALILKALWRSLEQKQFFCLLEAELAEFGALHHWADELRRGAGCTETSLKGSTRVQHLAKRTE